MEKEMAVEELTKKQVALWDKIYKNAKELGLLKEGSLEPIYDGVSDVEAYLESTPKIMWILKEPYDDKAPDGSPQGGGWYLTEHFKKDDVWKDLDLWKLIIQANYAIRTNKTWGELDYIQNNPDMQKELQRTAYVNLSKMPNGTKTQQGKLWTFYSQWKNILLEQIEIYNPDVIIFGYTFEFFREDLKVSDTPVSEATCGQWTSKTYKKNGRILIDAYHPSRKGGEDAGTYVTSIIDAVRKAR